MHSQRERERQKEIEIAIETPTLRLRSSITDSYLIYRPTLCIKGSYTEGHFCGRIMLNKQQIMTLLVDTSFASFCCYVYDSEYFLNSFTCWKTMQKCKKNPHFTLLWNQSKSGNMDRCISSLYTYMRNKKHEYNMCVRQDFGLQRTASIYSQCQH